MANTTFIDYDTRIVADWLNDVNDHTYNQISANLHPASSISFTPNGTITATNVQDAIEQASTLGGGGGGASSLNDLLDVNTGGATTGQVLKFNGLTWTPANDATTGGTGTDADTLDGFDGSYYLNYTNFSNTPSIPSAIGDLSNVSSASPSAGQVLKWSGSQWAPAADDAGGGVSGKLLKVAYSANPLETDQVTVSSTVPQTLDSVTFTKTSATSKLVITIVSHVNSNATTNICNTSLGVRIGGGTYHEIQRQIANQVVDPGLWGSGNGSLAGTWVETGVAAGSVTVTSYVSNVSAAISFTAKLAQITVLEVEA